jgi:hypothetical protein
MNANHPMIRTGLSAALGLFCLAACDDAGCPKGTTEDSGVCNYPNRDAPRDAGSSTGMTSAATSAAGSTSVSAGTAAKAAASTGPSVAGSASADSANRDSASASSGGSAGMTGNSAKESAGTGNIGATAGTSGGNTDAGRPTPAGDLCSGKAGQFVCDNAVLNRCGASGTSESQEPCMNEMYCQVGRAKGKCAVCNPGTFECSGARLDECMPDGQYLLKDTCPSAALCKKAAGACTEMTCKPGAKACTADGTLQTCNADGSALASSEPCGANLCDAFNGRCNNCVPGVGRCLRDDTVMRCGADGRSETAEPCMGGAGGCEASTCNEGECRTTLKAAGEPCAANRMCTNLGSCVECVTSGDCMGANQICQDTLCVAAPCGDGVIDALRGETCDPAHASFVGATDLCDSSCHVVDAIWRQRCATARAGGEAWPGSLAAGWTCSGQDTTSRICTTESDCPGSAACTGYFDPNNNELRACTITCVSAAFDQPPVKSTCPGSMMCIPVLGQGGVGQLGGTCGYQAI